MPDGLWVNKPLFVIRAMNGDMAVSAWLAGPRTVSCIGLRVSFRCRGQVALQTGGVDIGQG